MSGKKVVYAKLHSGFFIPQVGNMTDTLPPQSKTLPDFAMSLQEQGLLVTWTGYAGASRVKKSYLIGAATIVGCQFEDETITAAPPGETA